MDEIKDDNKFLVGVLVIGIVCIIAWLCHDLARNREVYHHTDDTMGDIDKRIQGIESRLDSMQNRLDENQKAVSRIAERIERGRENAEIIAGGIDQAEGRLDLAISRSQRIEEIIAEIERTNKQGKANP